MKVGVGYDSCLISNECSRTTVYLGDRMYRHGWVVLVGGYCSWAVGDCLTEACPHHVGGGIRPIWPRHWAEACRGG